MTLLLCVILVALVFEYINGFHDTANSIATVVSTRVMTPRQAVVMAALFNLLGALVGDAVAKTMGKGLVDTSYVTTVTVLCALLAGIAWNLLTWWLGLPSSSTHALVGGLCGAALGAAHGNWAVLHWAVTKVDPKTGHTTMDGLWPKVVIPMVTSPLCGFVVGFIMMGLLLWLVRHWRPRVVNAVFGKLQVLSACFMGYSHGFADAQKTMGIIALALFTATSAGTLKELPDWLGFLRISSFEIPLWVKLVCAVTMAAGTAAGGWRIIRTLGHKVVKIQPVHGFAAETTAATVLVIAGQLGMPVSTTHAISTSIMGVGASKRFSAVKWGLVERIVWAWMLTLPATAALAYGLLMLVETLGLKP
jgi:PiT family inorganic phosphate transporter